MHLTLNGHSRHFTQTSLTVDELLAELGLADKPVVVELNQQAILPAEYPALSIPDGAHLEIVTIAAGG